MNVNYLVLIVFIIAVNIINFIYLKKYYTKDKQREEVFPNQKEIAYLVAMYIVIIAGAVYLCVYTTPDMITINMKNLALVSLLFPVALIDFRQHIIPNKLLVVGIGCRVGLLIPETIWIHTDVLNVLFEELIVTIILVLICFIPAFIFKGSIGYGDIKLLGVMGLFQGTRVISSLMISLIISFFVALFLLITKKKGRKDEIAFGPSILIGTTIASLVFCV